MLMELGALRGRMAFAGGPRRHRGASKGGRSGSEGTQEQDGVVDPRVVPGDRSFKGQREGQWEMAQSVSGTRTDGRRDQLVEERKLSGAGRSITAPVALGLPACLAHRKCFVDTCLGREQKLGQDLGSQV